MERLDCIPTQSVGTIKNYPPSLRYVNVESANEMSLFPTDMAKVDTEVQRIDDQVLVRYFDEE